LSEKIISVILNSLLWIFISGAKPNPRVLFLSCIPHFTRVSYEHAAVDRHEENDRKEEEYLIKKKRPLHDRGAAG